MQYSYLHAYYRCMYTDQKYRVFVDNGRGFLHQESGTRTGTFPKPSTSCDCWHTRIFQKLFQKPAVPIAIHNPKQASRHPCRTPICSNLSFPPTIPNWTYPYSAEKPDRFICHDGGDRLLFETVCMWITLHAWVKLIYHRWPTRNSADHY